MDIGGTYNTKKWFLNKSVKQQLKKWCVNTCPAINGDRIKMPVGYKPHS